jgi:mannosylfructose-phosphate synthase
MPTGRRVMDRAIVHKEYHEEFLNSHRRHILMITNHGIHQWKVISGLPDTGGQNVYVNQLTDTLADFGFKITIANRGGYPHPSTGDPRKGIHYKDGARRIVYLEDGAQKFVRKEDMKEHIPGLAAFLGDLLREEGQRVDLIMSHYWDGALLGVQLNKGLGNSIPHLWIPHSLGAIKKRNMPPETWEKLRVDERIATEQAFIGELDYVAATSSLIRESLRDDYGRGECLFLPPCVDPGRFFPREVPEDHEIWDFLEKKSRAPKEELKKARFITEISRTDRTKRKDLLLRAFAAIRGKHPELRLIVSIEETEKELYGELAGLIRDLEIEDGVVILGHEAERLPFLYALTSVYCSPSVMEGFGMSVQEAAAEAVPVVGSDKIPFVTEYLLGEQPVKEEGGIEIGRGGIAVPADDLDALVKALDFLLSNEERRREMGRAARSITVPYFTWKEMTRRLLAKVKIGASEG